MAQQDNSTERVLVKFFLEWRAGFRAQVQRHILQSHAFRLVDLLQTIHNSQAGRVGPQHARCSRQLARWPQEAGVAYQIARG